MATNVETATATATTTTATTTTKTSPPPDKEAAAAAAAAAAGGDAESSKVVTLPLARVRTIMKSSPDVSNISQESLFLIAKSTELFIHHLTRKAMDRSPDKTSVEYRALADFVNGEDTMQFLQDIIPHKIKYGDYLKMMEDDSDCEVISSSSDSDDSASDDDVIAVKPGT